MYEQGVDVIKKGKVGVYLQHPVRLDDDDAPEIDQAGSSRQERSALHPPDQVV